jgi:UDP-N-acetylmuramyl pentapeptide phosphotransferase/UDP-N-acetylglucosamine-1-phosphate transferase
MLVFAASYGLMLLFGNPMIAWIKRLKGMKWSAREDTPDTHLKKSGTPSMGGIGIVGAALLSVFGLGSLYTHSLCAVQHRLFPQERQRLPRCGAILSLKCWKAARFCSCCSVRRSWLRRRWSKARGTGGLKARQKFAWQLILTAAFLVLYKLHCRSYTDCFSPRIRHYAALAKRL